MRFKLLPFSAPQPKLSRFKLRDEGPRLLIAGSAGALLAFFLDPDRGRRRRNMTRDRALATARRSGRRVTRLGRAAGAQVAGWQRALMARQSVQPEPLNDATLAHKVESLLFRDPSVPKGRINISAENGVIVLRGEVDRPDLIESLEAAARAVPGVVQVQNLLHLPSTPPGKPDALEAH